MSGESISLRRSGYVALVLAFCICLITSPVVAIMSPPSADSQQSTFSQSGISAAGSVQSADTRDPSVSVDRRSSEEVNETREPATTNRNGTAISATSAGSGGQLVQSADSGESFGEDSKIAVTVIPKGPSFAPDETMRIFVGAFTDSPVPSGLANVGLNVTVEQPDGETSEYSVTTNSDGNAIIRYDLTEASRGSGTYTITVTDGTASATINPDVGPSVEVAEREFEDVPIGEESDLDFLVRSGEFGQPGEVVNVTIEAPNETIIDERQTTSDADGFVTVPVTPDTKGRYEITAEVVETGATATHGAYAREIVFRSRSSVDWRN